MHGNFLLGAGAVLGALALAGVLARLLGQSVIPAYILMGIALRGVALDEHLVEVLATLGVVLLLFFMGLEFSLGALLRNRRRIVRDGSVDLLVCFPPGLIAGLLLGWGWTAGLLLGGALYVSSSAIIAKATIEMRRSANPETESALGVLVFEDLAMALFLAMISGAVLVDQPDAGRVVVGMGRAMLFCGVVTAAAVFGRRLLERAFDVESDELFLLLVSAVLLLLSWAAISAGLSEAIGAFLAGLMLSETEHRERVQRMFLPLEGLFAAVFFLSFGLSVNPRALAEVWPVALGLAVLGAAAKVGAGWWIGRLSGHPRRAALSLGLTLVPRGEFSVLLAGIAAAAGLTRVSTTIAGAVLALSLLGTAGMRYAPEISRRAFPRRTPTLAERGFMPDLAMHGPPPAGPREERRRAGEKEAPAPPWLHSD
ncbi:MAG TPA: cation:proton antiporter [Longimicrobium sp.]|nr:cation:proton antiporter [Longimicrobium sp.]